MPLATLVKGCRLIVRHHLFHQHTIFFIITENLARRFKKKGPSTLISPGHAPKKVSRQQLKFSNRKVILERPLLNCYHLFHLLILLLKCEYNRFSNASNGADSHKSDDTWRPDLGPWLSWKGLYVNTPTNMNECQHPERVEWMSELSKTKMGINIPLSKNVSALKGRDK